MKTLIIYQSIHKGNTEKIAKKMAEVLDADLKKPEEVKEEELSGYDLIGFGSGIYGFGFHVSILNLIKKIPEMFCKKAFVFSTHGNAKKGANKKVIKLLEEKGFNVVSDFESRGFCTWGPFGLIGGTAKGHPNEEDIAAAASFAESLK